MDIMQTQIMSPLCLLGEKELPLRVNLASIQNPCQVKCKSFANLMLM